jgi:hypothetical protein
MSDFDGEYMQKISTFLDIDRMFIFSYFMPHHNVNVVLDYLEKLNIKKRKRREYLKKL